MKKILIVIVIVLTTISFAFADEKIFIDPRTGTLSNSTSTGVVNSVDQPDGWGVGLTLVQGFSWSAAAECTVLPAADSPAWTLQQTDSTGQSVSVSGGILTIIDAGTGGGQSSNYYREWASDLDTVGVIVHLRMKVVSSSGNDALTFSAKDGSRSEIISFTPTYINFNDHSDQQHTITNGQYFELVVAIKSNKADIWVKDDAVGVWEHIIRDSPLGSVGGGNRIYFGSGSSPGLAESNWDFARYYVGYQLYDTATPTITQDISFPTNEHATFTSWDSITDCPESLYDVGLYNGTDWESYETDALTNTAIAGDASTAYTQVRWYLENSGTDPACTINGGVVGIVNATGDYPAVGDVESGVTYNFSGSTGTFTEPGVGNVEYGVQYGGNGTEFTGTFVVPGVGIVNSGDQYGADGTEFTGTLTSGGQDVIFGM